MATTFAAGLAGHLESKKKLTLLERRLKRILDAKPSKRRTAILAALETRARDKLGVGAAQKIDWGKVDWIAVLDFILKLLVILLPLFLGKPESRKPPRLVLGQRRVQKQAQ